MSQTIQNFFQSKLEVANRATAVRASTISREQTIKDIEDGVFALKFLEWVRINGRNEKGDKVTLTPYLEDWIKIHGDLRLSVVVTGCAQYFKSLSSFLLAYYGTQKGSLNILYTFAKSNIRDKIVGSTLNPLFEANLEVDGLENVFLVDNNKNKRTTASTLYTGFVYSPSNSDAIAVPPELQSISVDFEILDEYSQYNPKLAATLGNRMDNSPLFSKAQRFVSTPGKKGTGVDIQLQKCSHVFDAHVECDMCNQFASLNPLDCLLKKAPIAGADNEEVWEYFDENLRILDWNYHDELDKVNTAYIACNHCGSEIPPEKIKEARMMDKKTKLTVEEYLDEVNADPFKLRLVGIVAAPVLRSSKVPIAVRLISEGMSTDNPQNYVEQTLGLSSSNNFDGLTIDLIEKSVRSPKEPANPQAYTKYRVMGADIARSSHYGCIMDLHIPNVGSADYKYDNTIRSVVDYKRFTAHGISELWRDYDVDLGFVDLNPDQSLVVELCKQHDFYAAVQKHSIKEVFRLEKEVDVAGESFDRLYSINNQYFINRLIKAFQKKTDKGELLYRLPNSLEPDLFNTSSASVVGHFLNMTFNQEKNLWEKGEANRSDWFYATLFAEVACYFCCTEAVDSSWLEFFQD